MKHCLLIATFLYLLGGIVKSQVLPILVQPVGSDKWKYINIKGEIIDSNDYDLCYPFSKDGVAVAGYPVSNSFVILNPKGEIINSQLMNSYLNDVAGFENAGFSYGLLVLKKKETKWGCIDIQGDVKVPMKYDDLSPFLEGYATARIGENYFVINSNGTVTQLEPNKVCYMGVFKEGMAPFKQNKTAFGIYHEGFVDTTGKYVIPPIFLSVGYFSNGLAWARGENKMYGYINKSGEWVIEPRFTKTEDFDKESGLARFKNGEKWRIINKEGEEVLFENCEILDDFSEGLAQARKDYLLGFINNKGEWVIKPQFEGLRSFKNGYAAAKLNDLWGIIDKSGNWIVKPAYKRIRDVEVMKRP